LNLSNVSELHILRCLDSFIMRSSIGGRITDCTASVCKSIPYLPLTHERKSSRKLKIDEKVAHVTSNSWNRFEAIGQKVKGHSREVNILYPANTLYSSWRAATRTLYEYPTTIVSRHDISTYKRNIEMEGMVAYRVGLAIGTACRRDAAAAADGSLGDEGLVSGYDRVLLDFVADRLHFFPASDNKEDGCQPWGRDCDTGTHLLAMMNGFYTARRVDWQWLYTGPS